MTKRTVIWKSCKIWDIWNKGYEITINLASFRNSNNKRSMWLENTDQQEGAGERVRD